MLFRYGLVAVALQCLAQGASAAPEDLYKRHGRYPTAPDYSRPSDLTPEPVDEPATSTLATVPVSETILTSASAEGEETTSSVAASTPEETDLSSPSTTALVVDTTPLESSTPIETPIASVETPADNSTQGAATPPAGDELTTSTVFATQVFTVTSCAPEVTNCPNKPHVTTSIVAISTTVCPVSDLVKSSALGQGTTVESSAVETPGASESELSNTPSVGTPTGQSSVLPTAETPVESTETPIETAITPVDTPAVSSAETPVESSETPIETAITPIDTPIVETPTSFASTAAGAETTPGTQPILNGTAPVATPIAGETTVSTPLGPEDLTTSTIFETQVRTVTSCAPEVTNCPNRPHVTTVVVAVSTTVCPVSELATKESTVDTALTTAGSSVFSSAIPVTETPVSTLDVSTPGVETPGVSEAVSSGTPVVTAPGTSGFSSALPVGETPVSTPLGPGDLTTSTIFETQVRTVTSCAPEVTNCPNRPHVTTVVVAVSTTVCPVSELGSSTADAVNSTPGATEPAPTGTAPVETPGEPIDTATEPAVTGTEPAVTASGTEAVPVSSALATPATSDADAVTGTSVSAEELTTSTIFETQVRTVTSCAPEVTNCPNRPHVTTEIIAVSTTVCPVTELAGSGTTEAVTQTSAITTTSVDEVGSTHVSVITKTYTVPVTKQSTIPVTVTTGGDEAVSSALGGGATQSESIITSLITMSIPGVGTETAQISVVTMTISAAGPSGTGAVPPPAPQPTETGVQTGEVATSVVTMTLPASTAGGPPQVSVVTMTVSSPPEQAASSAEAVATTVVGGGGEQPPQTEVVTVTMGNGVTGVVTMTRTAPAVVHTATVTVGGGESATTVTQYASVSTKVVTETVVASGGSCPVLDCNQCLTATAAGTTLATQTRDTQTVVVTDAADSARKMRRVYRGLAGW